ncbi:hypothetical protein CTAYLR_000115 [Chrysophaeum taylorii]|uniref:Uncharacterized protein n=1 Tax=Chrysophaeum taylorii TaxID=2483200 RepID=A0AAD7XK72_9STRA|nr:hypothetical protein CTAYLR_000115 [Chrysophaeum taylorii]
MADAAAAPVPEGFTADPQQQAERAQREAQKQSILKQILTPAAHERLGRVKLVRREKAEAIEAKLVQMALGGQLQSQLTEDQLIHLLESQTQQAQPKVRIQRRNYIDDDDDDDNDDDLM